MNDSDPFLNWAGETIEGMINALVGCLNGLFAFLGVGRWLYGEPIQIQYLDW